MTSAPAPAVSPARDSRAVRPVPSPLVAALIATASAVAVVYRVPSLARGTLWAEDGRIFLQERAASGAVGSLFQPYDGYLHLVPRLLSAVLLPAVPLPRYALAVTVACALVTGVVSGFVYLAAANVVPWPPARAVLALLAGFAPIGPLEVLGNTANLHWVLLWSLPWLLLRTPRTRPGSALAGATLLVITLSEIQSAVFVPLLLVGRRVRRRWPMAAGMLAGLCVQAAVALTSPRDERPGEVPGLVAVARGYLVDPVLSTVLSASRQGGAVLEQTGLLVPMLLGLVLLAAAGYVVARGTGTQRILVLALVATSMVLWAAAVLVNHLTIDGTVSTFYFTRHTYLPSLFLLSLPLTAAAVMRRRGTHVMPWIVVLAVLVVLAANLQPYPVRTMNGPGWAAGVRHARTECERDGGTVGHVRAAPDDGKWTVRLSCTRLEHP